MGDSMADWYTMDTNLALDRLGTRREGLTEEEAARRLEEHGPNRLEERRGRSPIVAFLEQFTEVMVIVLIVAAVISFVVGESIDATMILIIVMLTSNNDQLKQLIQRSTRIFSAKRKLR